MRRRTIAATCAGAVVIALCAMTIPASASGDDNRYKLTRLVSDKPIAEHHDPNLVNAWGLVAGPQTPWWVANNASETSTLYDGAGNPLPLVVKVLGAPTGAVFNGGSGFVVSHKREAGPALFLFAGETGTIRGWNPNVPSPAPSTKAFTVVDMSGQDAIFKGLAIAETAAGGRLYATDFHNGRVDVFDEDFNPVHVAGAFRDPNLPAGYGPFGIQAIGNEIFVTYAKQDAAAEDDVAGAGFGYVDRFSPRGALLGRVASGGPLNAPWGIAWAPEGFGGIGGGDLLIGNFGDGKINVFDRESDGDFELDGAIERRNGNDMVIDGLWALQFGNGGPAGPTDTLFFTAGPNDERHGLFGSIEFAPES